MKKLIITMLTILGCGTAYALPVGNPAEASLLCDGLIWEGHCGCDPCDPCLTWCDAFSVRAGFYGDYVFNRHLRNRARNGNGNRAQLEHSHIYTNAGYFALNFWDRFDLFATLGATRLFLDGNQSTFGPFVNVLTGDFGARVEIESRTEFSWSVGGRGTLWECGCTALGIEGQYFRTEPRVSRITLGSLFSTYPTSAAPYLRSEYSEWQVGLGVSHRINILAPYVAVKWAGSRLHWQNGGTIAVGAVDVDGVLVPNLITLNDMINRLHWGFAVGVSLVDCEKAALTVEGRFGDEQALYVNGQIRF